MLIWHKDAIFKPLSIVNNKGMVKKNLAEKFGRKRQNNL